MKNPYRISIGKLEEKIGQYNSYDEFAERHPFLNEIYATLQHLDDLRIIAKEDGLLAALKDDWTATKYRWRNIINECEYENPPKLAIPSMPKSLEAKYRT